MAAAIEVPEWAPVRSMPHRLRSMHASKNRSGEAAAIVVAAILNGRLAVVSRETSARPSSLRRTIG